MKIVLPDLKNVTDGDLDISVFKEFGEVITYPISKTEELSERLEEADVILCNKTLLNHETLSKAKNLKYIGLFATGYNNVEIEYAKSRGITVCNAGGYSTDAVAQHTFALLLNHFCKISEYERFTNAGEWCRSKTFSPFIYPTYELNNKTLGIIGFGSIGRKVAKIALAFGMNVIANSRSSESVEKHISEFFKEDYEAGKVSFGTIEKIQEKADVISVHCPLNDNSNGMINKEFLSKVKKGVYIINTARGGIVNESALKEALETEKISGAAIDTVCIEPMDKNSVLLGTKNLTITPHIAWAPLETRERLLDIVASNLEAYLSGSPKNVIV